MAMHLGSRGGKGRYRPLSEINVTPMVDVMLVLLIVFMVTAPLMTSGVNVDLPKTNAAPIAQDAAPITVSISADGKVYLADDVMDLPDLVAKLQAASSNTPDRRIFVRGDKDVPYGRIIEVMGTITQGGFTKVALLAEGGPATATAPSVKGGATAPAPAAAAAPQPTPAATPRRR